MNLKFNTVNNKEHSRMLSLYSGQCSGSSMVSLASIISMCLVERFLAASFFV